MSILDNLSVSCCILLYPVIERPVLRLVVAIRSPRPHFPLSLRGRIAPVAIRVPPSLAPAGAEHQSLPCVKAAQCSHWVVRRCVAEVATRSVDGGIVVTPVLASLCEGGVTAKGRDGGRDSVRISLPQSASPTAPSQRGAEKSHLCFSCLSFRCRFCSEM